MNNNKMNRDYHQFFEETSESQSETKSESIEVKYIVITVLVIVIAVVLILAHINQYIELSRKNIQVERLKERRNELKTETTHLQLKISNLMSLERIEKVAKQKLEMKEPDEINYVVLKNSENEENIKVAQSQSKEENKNKKGITTRMKAWLNNVVNVQADTLE